MGKKKVIKLKKETVKIFLMKEVYGCLKENTVDVILNMRTQPNSGSVK